VTTIIEMMCEEKQHSLPEIARWLSRGSHLDSADKVYQSAQEGSTILLCFERFFYRTGNYSSMSILLREDEGLQYASIISFGGGGGFLSMGLGANRDFAGEAENALKKIGFSASGRDKK